MHVVVASSLFEWVSYPNPLCEFCGTEVLIYKPTGEVVFAVGESDNQVVNEPLYMLYITISYIVSLALCSTALLILEAVSNTALAYSTLLYKVDKLEQKFHELLAFILFAILMFLLMVFMRGWFP